MFNLLTTHLVLQRYLHYKLVLFTGPVSRPRLLQTAPNLIDSLANCFNKSFCPGMNSFTKIIVMQGLFITATFISIPKAKNVCVRLYEPRSCFEYSILVEFDDFYRLEKQWVFQFISVQKFYEQLSFTQVARSNSSFLQKENMMQFREKPCLQDQGDDNLQPPQILFQSESSDYSIELVRSGPTPYIP